MAFPALGSIAPDFALPSTAGGEVSLAQFRGSQYVILAFFPLAFTSTCTAEMCAFSEDYAAFVSSETAVLPISVDAIPSLKAYKERERMQVDLLSDFKRVVSRLYGTLDEERYLSRRAYVLIDKDGIVQWTFLETESGRFRETSELLARVSALR